MSSQFLICILPSERPFDASLLRIAALLPGVDLGIERGTIRQAPVKALTIKDADFDFGHVEPTGMLRGVVEYDAAQQCLRFLNAEHFLETLAEMGGGVIRGRMDAVCRKITLSEQMPDEGHEVGLGSVIGHHDGTPPALGLHRHEQIAGAGANVLVIHPHGRSGLDRQWGTRMLEQLLALLVQTDDRFPRPERTGVEVEQIVHPVPILLCQRAHAPHQLAPRFEAVFFSSRRMVSRLIGPIPACACAVCSSSSSVQRFAPDGGTEQASAEICASTSVPYRRGLPGRAASCSAYSTPPSRYALRVRQMTVRPTPRTAMIWASGTSRSRADRICARLTPRAWRTPFARYDSINSRSSSVRCNSVCRMTNSSSQGGYATA